MKVLLINPNKLLPKNFNLTQKSAPPLGLALIAAVFKANGFEVDVFDFVAENPDLIVPFNEDILVQGESIDVFLQKINISDYCLIGISIMFSNNWLANRELINRIKQFNNSSIIVAGGEHVSALPEFCLETCFGLDMIVKGEGEGPIVEICNRLKNNQNFENLKGVYLKQDYNRVTLTKPNRIEDLMSIPYPAWEVFPLKEYNDNNFSWGVSYAVSLPIIATRGCPYECTFCSSPEMWGRNYSMRTVESVIDEIEYLKNSFGVTNIDFYDLTAILKKEWIVKLCKEIIKRGLKITFQIPGGTRSEAIDYEVAILLKQAGCKNITYAPETGSVRMLKEVKKKVKLSSMLNSIKASNQAGLIIKLNIIIGYPNERIYDLFGTLWFLIKASFYGAHDTSPSIFNPYPGSKLFQQLVSKGKIELNDDYFQSIVYSETLHTFKNYNENLKRWQVVFFQYFIYLTFYFTNYLFRPVRFFKLIRNIITNNAETRGEWMLIHIFKSKSKTI